MSLKDRLKIKKIGDYFIPALKNHPAWCLLLAAFLLAVYALIIFGSYAVNDPVPAPSASNLKIDNALYERVLSRLKARDAAIQQGIEQQYPDIFR